MNLKEKSDQVNDVIKNIVPLGNDEIKSILKTQSEAVFQDKNLTNNSNFIKKSLIDIAFDFQSRENNKENLENTDNLKEEGAESEKKEKIEEISTEDANQTDKTVKDDSTNEMNELHKVPDQSSVETELVNKNNIALNTTLNDLDIENNESENITETNIEIDTENINSQNQDEINENKIISDTDIKVDETQQALESVRDAVSQSLNKIENENGNLNENKEIQNDVSDIIAKDFNKFKDIFSSLSNLGEKAIYEAMQSKIIDIAYELAGYQIDKIPEKYEKKIRSLLKNINCFEDKMKIEVNDQDYDALSKIENFFDNKDKSIFISNQDLSRGDIILTCDGMHYSEKSNKN
tara:strand:- start:195 stop:1244 length:1050 start_codon:yes stop_codon:yes gene_type:complete